MATSRYQFPNDDNAIGRRVKLAFACLLTAVGIPMILAGDEFVGRRHDECEDKVNEDQANANVKDRGTEHRRLLYTDVFRQRFRLLSQVRRRLQAKKLSIDGVGWVRSPSLRRRVGLTAPIIARQPAAQAVEAGEEEALGHVRLVELVAELPLQLRRDAHPMEAIGMLL